jgi:TonB-linked SusC/RagA family outer membrane protein
MKFKNENYYGERYDMGRFYRHEDTKSQSVNDERNIAFNSFITYNRTIGKHTFTAMAGTEWKSFYGTTMEAKKDSFPIDLITFDAGNNNKAGVSGHDLEPEKWVSYFGRLVYNYQDKYLLQANFRRDGSSKFGENNRYGNFPSFSAGWRITNEPFMESIKSFMDLKIRGGWGIIGNSSIGNFKYLATVNSNGIYYAFGSGPNQAPFYGAKPNSFPNQGVHWEEFNSTNIGFDLGLFNSSLMITADVYSRINKGMLIEVDLPFSSGYYEPWSSGTTTINVGECSNKGFEFTATYRKQISGLNFTVSGNMAYNKNNIEKLYSDNAIIKGSMSQYVTEAGMPMSYYKGYEVERLFQATTEDSLEIFKRANVVDPTKYDPAKKLAPGDLKYVDQDGDGKITEEDKVMIGNPWPKYIYGLNITAEYKGFDLTLFAQGVAGKDIYNYQRRYAETFTGDYCPTKAILDSWTVDNPDTYIPRMNYKDPNRNFSTSSSYFVESGSYFRLKNLQLGYTLPRKVQDYLHLSNLRLYVGAQNVFTITKYSGIDPEFSSGDNTNKDEDNGNYPQNRLYQFGFQIEF